MVGVTSTVEAVFAEKTYKNICRDAVFYRVEAEKAQQSDDKNKYARTIITLMALYLESISNVMYSKTITQDLDAVDNRTELPKPIRRFRAVHEALIGQALPDDLVRGIRDIFTIRNKIMAHSSGISELKIGQNSQKREDINMEYRKLFGFPYVYSHFDIGHADLIVDEVKQFLANYLKSIKNSITNEQFNLWSPSELESIQVRSSNNIVPINWESIKTDMRWYITFGFAFIAFIAIGIALIIASVNMSYWNVNEQAKKTISDAIDLICKIGTWSATTGFVLMLGSWIKAGYIYYKYIESMKKKSIPKQ